MIKPSSDSFGIALYSKYELANVKDIMSAAGVKSIFAKTNINSKIINLYLTHPLPPVSKLYWLKRNEQYQETIDFLLKKKVQLY